MRRRLLVLLGSTSPATTDRIPFSRPFPAPHREGEGEGEVVARERERERARELRGVQKYSSKSGVVTQEIQGSVDLY
jgi:hypothetical protein